MDRDFAGSSFKFAGDTPTGDLMSGKKGIKGMADRLKQAVADVGKPPAPVDSVAFSKPCSAIRKNEYVMIKGRPCKLLSISDKGYLSLMDLETCDTKDDVRLPTETLANKLKADFNKKEAALLVTIISVREEYRVDSWEVKD
ncbi:Eukaryotic initiation factor 5A hypusine, DNA-binding OB fold protein [Aphelenchoides fujianensis]|nr:Eukaryotic initiation factor 5A hypusine, DNA-binding OB fold protein [Aphelenchoides fujianensis]